MNIRLYKNSDYEMICDWWDYHGEPIPPKSFISEHTFILENSEWKPWLCLSLITFNTPHIAWSAGLVSNPDIPPHGRKEAVKKLWDFVAETAKDMGYNNLLCFAAHKSLEKRYSELGFTPTKNVTCMIRQLGD